MLIGIISGVVCYYAVALKNRLALGRRARRLGRARRGGFLGIILLGVFATTAFNPAGADGLLAGNAAFFLKQCVAVLVSSVWAFVFTLGMLWLIDRITPVKVDAIAEEMGLDESLHGEQAYIEAL